MKIRQPIVCILGHVDHGKTTLADYLRGSNVAEKEAGRITQHIGATEIPIDVIIEKSKKLAGMMNFDLKIPGILLIDTPGHQAFTTLRKRGGSIADLAILVVDINQGIQPQTVESIEILRAFKTPFIVAATKIDMIKGWRPTKDAPFLETIKNQDEHVIAELEEKIYRIVYQLAEQGFNAERFDRVKDFTSEVCIVPVSGITGEGVPELLLLAAGLSQKFLSKNLVVDENSFAKGVILEVNEIKGLGNTIDVILYDGKLSKNDTIYFLTKDKVLKESKIRAILKPKPLKETKDKSKDFDRVDEVYPAAGIKILGDVEDALPGSPIVTDKKYAEENLLKEVEDVQIETDEVGVIVKADTLGSLEGLIYLLKQNNIPIRRAEIGVPTKKDVIEANSIKQQNRYYGVLIVFNQEIPQEVLDEIKRLKVKVIKSNVIYSILDEYNKYVQEEKEKEKLEKMKSFIYPAKLKYLEGCTFRISKPAIIGVEVLEGIIKPGYPLMLENGKVIGEITGIQKDKKSVGYAEKGDRVAIAIDGPTVGRQIKEGNVLYTAVPISQLDELIKDFDNVDLIKEIRKIRWKYENSNK